DDTNRSEYHAVEGEVCYDSFTPEDIASQYRGDVIYCPEDNVHFPTLTVEQTLSFAIKTHTPCVQFTDQSRDQFNCKVVEILLAYLVFIIPETLLLAMRQFVRMGQLHAWFGCIYSSQVCSGAAHRHRHSSYYYDLCIIAEGKMAYFGPPRNARQYFIDMGMNRSTGRLRPTSSYLSTSSFLVTNPDGRKVNCDTTEDYHSHYVGNSERKNAYRQSVVMEHASTATKSNPYIISIPMHRAVMVRRVQIIKGDKGTVAVNLVVQILQAIVMGTVFLKLPEATFGYFSRGGVLFLYAAMYYPFIESFAHTVVDISFTFIIQAVFAVMLYFLVGLQRMAPQFLIFFLFIFFKTTTMKAFFRMVDACFKTESAATSVAGVIVIIVSLFAGYTVPKPNIPGALCWMMYLNACVTVLMASFQPVDYGFEAVLMNEFHTLNGTCSMLVRSGPGYENVSLANQVCSTVGAQPGQNFADGNLFTNLSYDDYYSHLWRHCFFDTAVTHFKQGSCTGKVVAESIDEEKVAHAEPVGRASTDVSPAVLDNPSATDIFTWRHLEYTVPISGGQYCRLLDDIPGYV
ncbi:hypothetical protein M405DRAFT_847520, partial [Rhizopogon salebrosus TDB-379]